MKQRVSLLIIFIFCHLALMAQAGLDVSGETDGGDGTDLPAFVPLVKVGKALYEGDSIQYVELNPLAVYPQLVFKNDKQRQAYNRLVANVKKVLPIAKEVNHIIIETYDFLQTLPNKKAKDEHLKRVEWFVVDEIHELATTERGAQMCVAMERLAALAGEYQRIGLSATVGNVNAVARFLSGIKRDIRICKHDTFRSYEIDVECPQPCEDPILLDKLQCDPDMLAVMKRAKDLIENGRSTLLFVNTRETAEWMAARYHIWDENMSIDVQRTGWIWRTDSKGATSRHWCAHRRWNWGSMSAVPILSYNTIHRGRSRG